MFRADLVIHESRGRVRVAIIAIYYHWLRTNHMFWGEETASIDWKFRRVKESIRKRLYYPHVEGLRGLTAFYVFLYHFRGFASSVPDAATLILFTPFLNYGHYAVSVFIVISGFCLAAPVALDPEKAFDGKAFVIRRFRRIYPAYFGALVVSLVAFLYWSAAAVHHIVPSKDILAAFAVHAVLLHNLFQKTAFYLNVPMWSVGAEVQIYFLFAFLLVPLWRRYGVAVQACVALVLGISPHFLLHGMFDWTCPWFLGLFAMGICAAAFAKRGAGVLQLRILATVVVAVSVVTIVKWPVDENAAGYGPFLVTDLLVGCAVALFLMAAVDTESRLWMPARVLSFAPIVWLGTFAYSLYLLHGVGISVLKETLRRVNAGTALSDASCIIFLPLMLAISYGFYVLLERPFMSAFLRRGNRDVLVHHVPVSVIVESSA